MAIYSDNELEVTARIFPTNCEGSFHYAVRGQEHGERGVRPCEVDVDFSSGYGSFVMPDGMQFVIVNFHGDVPSRLNTNFIYRCRDVKSSFSTDIATGAKSSVYPPKVSHWGSGIVGDGYDFSLMIRNNKHDTSSTLAKGTLQFFGLDTDRVFELEISAESAISIKLSDLDQRFLTLVKNEAKVFTWLMKLDQPDSETFWISHRRDDGCILGEHGF